MRSFTDRGSYTSSGTAPKSMCIEYVAFGIRMFAHVLLKVAVIVIVIQFADWRLVSPAFSRLYPTDALSRSLSVRERARDRELPFSNSLSF